MSERTDPLAALGRDCAAAVVSFLDVQSALSLSACSKAWRQLVLDDEPLWQTRAVSDLPPPLLRAAAAAAAAGHCTWHAAYKRATRLQSLRCVAWSSEGGQQGRSIAGRQPRPREGHAACPWGARSMLVCGGFGGGILSGGDLHLLTPAKCSSGGGRSSGSSSPTASGNGGSGSGSGSLRWVQPKVANRPPVHRYGHTLTRCGPAGELAVLYGGLQAGGYQAPLDTLAVLRRKGAAASGSGAAAAGAPQTAGPAAAADSTTRGGSDGGGGSGGGSEEETSLALRLGGWQGGADGGGLQQLLWAQMFDFFMGQDEDDDEEEEEEGESDDAELSDGDSQGAGSSEEEGEDGWESASGGEYDSGEEDGSDKEWLPNHSARTAAGTAARPASVVAAMARRSSSPDSPAAAAGAGRDAAGVGTATTAGGLHQLVAGALRATAPDAAAAGAAAWCDEDATLADEELEWFYPRVSGEPPGARGYHSAAASEDGSKLFVFGGISATGACNTLAVLDLATWEWSRPPTHGTPPSPRCGHSSFVYRNRLWVVGGGSGRDLLRSGRDLGDVHCLDLASMEWRRLALPTGPLCAGKCHASALVGRRLLLFGGSMASCNELAWLDLEQERWGAPVRVLGPPPCERMSATAVLCGDEVVVFGGYTFNYREVGDVHRLKLLPAAADSAAASEADARDERSAARRRQRWGPWW